MISTPSTARQRVFLAVIVCAMAGVLIFLACWMVKTQEDSATLAAAQRLVMSLEDYQNQHGRFPESLTNLLSLTTNTSGGRLPEIFARFDYSSDGRSYQLKCEAQGPVVLRRAANAAVPGAANSTPGLPAVSR